MFTSRSIKARGITLTLAVVIAGCGGGGGEPGGSPHADNSATTMLHPETYVERWWPGCKEGSPCTPPAAR